MSQQQQQQLELVPFSQADKLQVYNSMRDKQLDYSSCKGWLVISTTIQSAIGSVPRPVLPLLQSLQRSYSSVDARVKSGLAQTCAEVTKFLIKAGLIFKNGYNDEKLRQLQMCAQRLNGDYVQVLDNFVETSREELIGIAVQLTGQAQGSVAEALQEKRKTLEQKLKALLVSKGDLQIECGKVEGEICALQCRINFLQQTKHDKHAAKQALEREIGQLKSEIPAYEAEIVRRKNTNYEERGSFWIFSWKIRDVHVDNGENIARENLNRLMSRIDQAKVLLNNIDDSEVQQRLEEAEKLLPVEIMKKEKIMKQIAELAKEITTVENEFDSVLQELEQLYRTAGSSSLEALKKVDDLARDVDAGVYALTSAYATIKVSLLTIDHDPEQLISSVKSAIDLLAISDAFIGGSRALETVKMSLLPQLQYLDRS